MSSNPIDIIPLALSLKPYRIYGVEFKGFKPTKPIHQDNENQWLAALAVTNLKNIVYGDTNSHDYEYVKFRNKIHSLKGRRDLANKAIYVNNPDVDWEAGYKFLIEHRDKLSSKKNWVEYRRLWKEFYRITELKIGFGYTRNGLRLEILSVPGFQPPQIHFLSTDPKVTRAVMEQYNKLSLLIKFCSEEVDDTPFTPASK